MKHISLDFETFSSVDLKKSGLYRYSESPDFEILLFGYSVDGGAVRVVDIACGESIPQGIIDALTDDEVTKSAHNSAFERVCLSRYLRDRGMSLDPFADNHFASQYLGKAKYLNPTSWRCSMVWAAYMGLPLSLESTGVALGLEKQKLKEGKDLIRYFCSPCKPTATNGQRTRNLPEHAPYKWKQFKNYNIRDVEAEMAIQERLAGYPVPDFIWEEYCQDQEINDRGVRLDMELVRQAIAADAKSRAELTRLMKEITELDNPNSVLQMKEWLADHGLETDTLGKKAVAELLKTAPEPLGKALALRQQLAKSSVRKYQAMENAVCADGRARGMFQFYGANRTGRFSGRLIQVQNLPQNHMPDLEQARELVKSGNFAALEMLYDSVPDVLSELIRTAFIPKDGRKFIVADFASIERVVLAWLAGEQWVLDAYKEKQDLYIATASQMFKVSKAEIDKKHPLRQKGKVADLACVAEGTPVLTDCGVIPIEQVTTQHNVWNGYSYVPCGGAVFNEVRDVICVDGLVCTPDHLLLTTQGWVESGKCEGLFWAEVSAPSEALRCGKRSSIVITPSSPQPVYDIRHCGEQHRFAVLANGEWRIVHNCGYGGSVGALKAMGALEMGLTEDELQPLVTAWRAANPNITRLWRDVDHATMTAVKDRTETHTHGIRFICRSGMLFITLPSGRHLAYVKPRIGTNKFGSDCVTYEGVGATKQWERLESFGSKFVENLVQGISRDILAHAMRGQRCSDIVMHCHDEIVIEADRKMSISALCEQMGRTPPWAEGLLLRAEGYECDFYKKG